MRPEFHELGMADAEAWDSQDRVEFVAAIEARVMDAWCRACSNGPGETCICRDTTPAEDQAFRRRIKNRSTDWTQGATK